jgi:hypothetical protein
MDALRTMRFRTIMGAIHLSSFSIFSVRNYFFPAFMRGKLIFTVENHALKGDNQASIHA